LLLVAGCAEVGAPPGGELDRTGPRLLDSYPANGSLNVPPGHEITLIFSERVVKPERADALYISPRPRVDAKVQWKSNRVSIRLFDPFQPDQTYVVSVATALTDLRGNPLDTAITLAFSTGQTLDSGTVSGSVLRDGRPAAGTCLALYAVSSYSDSLVYDSLPADYITTSNKDGVFAFKYLPNQPFQLIGFEDKNRNQFFEPQTEPFALPDRSVVVGGDLRLDKLRLVVTSRDTLAPTVLSTVITPDNLVKTRLSRAISTAGLKSSPSDLTLTSLTAGTTIYPAVGFLEADTTVTQLITAVFTNLEGGLYCWVLVYDSSKPPIVRDSLTFEKREDKTAPTIVRFQPGTRSYYADRVDMRLTLSEPIDRSLFSPETFFLRENDSLMVPLKAVDSGPFSIQLIPERLLPGKRYRLDVAEFDLVDLAGNSVGDSILTYQFSTLDQDSLGSISGTVAIGLPERSNAPVVLVFEEAGKKVESYRTVVRGPVSTPGAGPQLPQGGARPYSVELPAGRYLLSAFVDEDNDGFPSHGQLYPYRRSETQAILNDTIAVRARFETAGIDLVID